MMARLSVLAASAAIVAAGTSWELPVWARGGKIWADLSAKQGLGNSTVNIYQQVVDHADPSSKTFNQRWVAGVAETEACRELRQMLYHRSHARVDVLFFVHTIHVACVAVYTQVLH